jgi:hypothetical protein
MAQALLNRWVMKTNTSFACLLLALMPACTLLAPTDSEGGANSNDRTNGGTEGEPLLTGAMVIATHDSFALMQRNTVSVFVDFSKKTTEEFPSQVSRFVFSKQRAVGYAILDNQLVAYELPSLKQLWRSSPASGTLSLLKVADSDQTLIVADSSEGYVVDTRTGEVLTVFDVSAPPRDVAFLPDGKSALVVGQTSWDNHLPQTPVSLVDLAQGEKSTVQVPNCEAPVAILPSGSRALLSPTYCQEGLASTTQQTWTNPDPVSVIDIVGQQLKFVKNLPGFGPVALSPEGDLAVAYLDTKRMDPAMFENRAQIPGADASQFHLMAIDPVTLQFSLTSIGPALPRFAMSRDGKGLLVDATVQAWRGKANASAQASFGPDGFTASAQLSVFAESAPFGYFDLQTLQYKGFSGPGAALDRFVQTADATRVFTLKSASDGLGGDLFRIDLNAKSTADLGQSLRDIGVLPDGLTLVLRIRTRPAQVGGNTYLQEDYCLSLDGVRCMDIIHYRSKSPQPSSYCDKPENYHDC